MATAQKLKIAVIEDNPQTLDMFCDFLSEKFPESEVLRFSSGERALKEIHVSPDIFILDYNLDSVNPAAMNGLQLMLKLKELFNATYVFISSQERTEVSANVIKYGAYDYVSKNQDAFHRLEIIIKNIIKDSANKEQIRVQKSSINALIVILSVLIAGLLFLKLL